MYALTLLILFKMIYRGFWSL